MLPLSHDVFELRIVILYICIVLSLMVLGTMIYMLYKFRKTKNSISTNFHKRISIEVFWTIIPFIILILMVLPATIAFHHKYGSGNRLKKINLMRY